MIKAITFDFGGTLATGKLDVKAYRNRLHNYIHSLGHPVSKFSLKNAMDGMLVKLRKARERNLEPRFEELYSHVLHQLGIHAYEETLNHIYELYLQSFTSEMIPGVEEVLEILHRGYWLAVISNATSNFPRHTLKKSGLNKFFKIVVVSRDIGFRKPDPRIFKYALEKLQVKPEEALHVGDSIRHDVIGAKNAHMKVVWIKRGEEKVIEEPDYVISSIKKLPRILNEIEATFSLE